MALAERVSYLRGLAEGMGLTEDEKQGKFFRELLICLEEISDEVDYIGEDQNDMEEYLESIDEDLDELENYVYDMEMEDEDIELEDDFFDFMPQGDYQEEKCPDCGETIGYFDDADEPVKILCPNCDGVVKTIGEDNDKEAE